MFSLELTVASRHAIDELLLDVRERFPAKLKAESEAEVVTVAARLNENIKRAFKAGVDKHGLSHDKTGWTIGTFHVEPHALGAFVVLGGAAYLVEEGFKAHPIDAKSDDWLMFRTADGGFVKTKHVNHPGYKGDKFVERGLEATDLGPFVAKVVGQAYASVFLRNARLP